MWAKMVIFNNMINLSNILNIMSDRSADARELVKNAWEFSKEAHKNQKRLSGEPYICHPGKVAFYLAEAGMDKDTIAAGLLHDTLEDTKTTPDELEKLFGKDVKNLVEGVTRLGDIKYRGFDSYSENLRRLFIATAQDIRTIIIKLVDRLHNVQTLEYHNKERQKRKALETLEIYVPIADRLGMSYLKKDLEDTSFSFIDPIDYKKMKHLQESEYEKDKKQIKSILNDLIDEFKKNKIDLCTQIKFKGIYSLYKKLKRKDGDLSQINDLFSISVIVPTNAECYKALGIIHNNWTPLPKEIKDFIAFPKPNGYQAIHTTIFREDGKALEIQISTHEMNLRSKYGIVSFFSPETLQKRLNKQLEIPFSTKKFILSLLGFFGKDKESINKSVASEKVPAWLRGMVTTQKKITRPDEFIKSLESDFFEHRIFVFNSKGEVIDLPIDSNPIDFAYALGKKIGNHFELAKVNHHSVPIDTQLKNGDIVEITTSSNSHPNKNWLRYVKTTLAKQSIHTYIKDRG